MNGALLGGSLLSPSEFQKFWRRNFGRFACCCRNFVESHVLRLWSFPNHFFLMLDLAPCTRKLRNCVFHLAEWAPEAVMILLAASHKFLVRKDVHYFIWFELSQCHSVKFSVEPVLRLQCFCFVFGRTYSSQNPNPYPVQNILPHGYGAIDGGLFRRHLLAISASKKVEWFYRAVQRATKVQVA